MKIDFNNVKPVYVQIAEAIEDDIIKGVLKEGTGAYSQLVLSKELSINPATAAKGINLLVTKGILVKQRGTAMTVAIGAAEKLIKERRESYLVELIEELVNEAKKINLSEDNMIFEIKKYYRGLEEKNNG